MPTRKSKPPVKIRVLFDGGPADNRIEDIVLNGAAPKMLYVPMPPANFSEDPDLCVWSVGGYKLSTHSQLRGDPSIDAVYQWDGPT